MEHFFELLRYSLGITDSFEAKLSPEEWKKFFEESINFRNDLPI